MRHILLSATVFGAFVALAACSDKPDTPQSTTETPAATSDQAELIGLGETIATTVCATCHAVTKTDKSPHADAKPFREFSWSYDIETLAEPLAEGIMVGHPDMPEFEFEVEQVDALLAYIQSVQIPEPT